MHPSKRILAVISTAVILGTACSALDFARPTPTSTATATVPTATPTLTRTPTRSSTPTSMRTSTKAPSDTPLPPPTSAFPGGEDAVSVAAACRTAIDGIGRLKAGLAIPDHLMGDEPYRLAGDFDPNAYFAVLKKIKMQSGYALDYVYFFDELGGKPLIYARKSGQKSFKSYEAFLASFGEERGDERSYTDLPHMFDFLERVKVDRSDASYFEYLAMAYMGDQFYLSWHGLYNDRRLLCDSSDLALVKKDLAEFDSELPADVLKRAKQIDFAPTVRREGQSVFLRIVTFTKWGGFVEGFYELDAGNPFNVLDYRDAVLIKYDCGISF